MVNMKKAVRISTENGIISVFIVLALLISGIPGMTPELPTTSGESNNYHAEIALSAPHYNTYSTVYFTVTLKDERGITVSRNIRVELYDRNDNYRTYRVGYTSGGVYSSYFSSSYFGYSGLYTIKVYEDNGPNSRILYGEKKVPVGEFYTDRTDYSPGDRVVISAYSTNYKMVNLTIYHDSTHGWKCIRDLGAVSFSADHFANLSWYSPDTLSTKEYQIRGNFSTTHYQTFYIYIRISYDTKVLKNGVESFNFAPGDTVTISTRVTGAKDKPLQGREISQNVSKLSKFHYVVKADYEKSKDYTLDYTLDPFDPYKGIYGSEMTSVTMNRSQSVTGTIVFDANYVNPLDETQNVVIYIDGKEYHTYNLSPHQALQREFIWTLWEFRPFRHSTTSQRRSQTLRDM